MIKARILIIEDEAILAADLAEILQGMGHTIAGIAPSSPMAMRIVRDTRPELILMDINIQGPLDGIATARILKEIGSDAPVIFLTSYSDRDTVKRASEVEPFGYLLKPFDEPLIRITIEVALYKHAMEKEREKLQRELAESQVEVTTLSGLLPICAHCKKIRNDSGHWEQIDSYISTRSKAQFSHGICSDCFEKHHPEIHEHLISEMAGQGEGAPFS